MSLSFKIERTSHSKNSDPQHQSIVTSSSNRTLPTTARFSRRFDDLSDEDEHHYSADRINKRSIELISDFDSTRDIPKSKDERDQLLIPALPDRDFRAIHLARKKKRSTKELYKPDALNSLGGPEKQTKDQTVNAEGVDKVNSKAITGGLEVKEKSAEQAPPKTQDDQTDGAGSIAHTAVSTPLGELHVAESPEVETILTVPETIEQRAVRELLSQAGGELPEEQKPIEAIHMPSNQGSKAEDDSDSESGDEIQQFRRDLSRRPDSSTLEDYDRVPVGQFGLAMLKGMGWKEGTSTSKRGRVGLVEAYVPQARPSLLGIGAKPLIIDANPTSTNGNSQKVKKAPKPDRKYVPLLRKVIDHGGSGGVTPKSDGSGDPRSDSELGDRPSRRRNRDESSKFERSSSSSNRHGDRDRASDCDRYDEDRKHGRRYEDWGRSSGHDRDDDLRRSSDQDRYRERGTKSTGDKHEDHERGTQITRDKYMDRQKGAKSGRDHHSSRERESHRSRRRDEQSRDC